MASDGTQSDAGASDAAISYGGNYVVFVSAADNLVAGTSTSIANVYVHDMQTGVTSIVSTSSSGQLANGGSDYPVVSADGRFIVFTSTATNLVSGTNDSTSQIYEKDMLTGTTKLLSKNSTGSEANQSTTTPPSISCDGGVVAFASTATNLGATSTYKDIYIDVLSGGDSQLTNITSAANQYSDTPVVSCDGNEIAFQSHATNLVSGDDNGAADIFEYNRSSNILSLVSVTSSGTQICYDADYPSISGDGRFVSFHDWGSLDDHVVGAPGAIYIHDLKDGSTQALAVDPNLSSRAVGDQTTSISADGSVVAFVPGVDNLISGATYSDIMTTKSGY